MAQRSFVPCFSGSVTSLGVWRTISNRSLPGLVVVRFADFSLAFPCSEERVHSGLYDGLTWPDTGCASLD